MPDLTVQVLEAWIAHYANDPYVIDQVKAMETLHNDVFVRQNVKHIDFSDDIPEKFNKEMYISTFRKIWATIRHDIYEEIKKRKKELRKEVLPDEDFAEIYKTVHDRFEKIRGDIYCLMMDQTDIEDGKAREIMQKAYVTYSTVTHIESEDGEGVRSRWADQVNVVLKKHGEYIN